jgi:hypothetical protein
MQTNHLTPTAAEVMSAMADKITTESQARAALEKLTAAIARATEAENATAGQLAEAEKGYIDEATAAALDGFAPPKTPSALRELRDRAEVAAATVKTLQAMEPEARQRVQIAEDGLKAEHRRQVTAPVYARQVAALTAYRAVLETLLREFGSDGLQMASWHVRSIHPLFTENPARTALTAASLDWGPGAFSGDDMPDRDGIIQWGAATAEKLNNPDAINN